jgi:RNA-binding motif X-linked protein 2
MNPLTQIKNTRKATQQEISLGLGESASWHARFRHSAYIFTGGLDYDLTEGDLLAVFAQYGEIVDVNLVRDRTTGKSKGFAFLAYDDQRSTVLAVDNLNGAKVANRTIRVEHVDNYKKWKEEVSSWAAVAGPPGFAGLPKRSCCVLSVPHQTTLYCA